MPFSRITQNPFVFPGSLIAATKPFGNFYCRLLRLLVRCQHHHHLPAFHFGELLDHCMFLQVGLYPFQQRQTQLLVGNLTATEAQRDLGLVAVLQESDEISQLDVVITFVGAGAELDFFNLNLLLLETRLVLFFCFRRI